MSHKFIVVCPNCKKEMLVADYLVETECAFCHTTIELLPIGEPYKIDPRHIA